MSTGAHLCRLTDEVGARALIGVYFTFGTVTRDLQCTQRTSCHVLHGSDGLVHGRLLRVFRVSTTSGNTGNLLEFNWSSWKFLTDGTTTKESSHKNLATFQLFGRW